MLLYTCAQFRDEERIAATLESALGQTWPRCEIIVVDDGSRDGSLALARRFESRGVKVIAQANAGAAAARQVGEDFESMFLSQMLSPIFNALKTDGPFGGGHAEGMYRSFLVDAYAKAMTRSGGIGIADQVVRSVMLQFQEASQK